jgi:hypothetical protein
MHVVAQEFKQPMYNAQNVAREYRILNSVEISNKFRTPNIIRIINSRRIRWAEHVARMKEVKNRYKILVGGPEEKRPIGRPRRRWEYNIKIYV